MILCHCHISNRIMICINYSLSKQYATKKTKTLRSLSVKENVLDFKKNQKNLEGESMPTKSKPAAGHYSLEVKNKIIIVEIFLKKKGPRTSKQQLQLHGMHAHVLWKMGTFANLKHLLQLIRIFQTHCSQQQEQQQQQRIKYHECDLCVVTLQPWQPRSAPTRHIGGRRDGGEPRPHGAGGSRQVHANRHAIQSCARPHSPSFHLSLSLSLHRCS